MTKNDIASVPFTASAMRATHAILRIGVAVLFMEHALQKFGLLGGVGPQTPPLSWTAMGATVFPIGLTRLVVAGWMELIGGLLLTIGVLTRPVAVVLLAEMIIAFFWAHFPRGGSPLQNGGEITLVYALVFAYLAAAGAGPFSVDERTAS
jgi:putative oxidoreductase